MNAKRLLIVTGPQGSGNHLFSRIFSSHALVKGWDALRDQYWIPSDEEPFAPFWVTPQALSAEVFAGHDYFLANVSYPFFYDGVRRAPKIAEVAQRAGLLGVRVQIAIVVRDQNINALQQQRVGGEVTLGMAQHYYYDHLLEAGYPVHFLDHEALFLHGRHYLRWLGRMLDFPLDWDSDATLRFISEDANRKYVVPVAQHWLDQTIRAGRQPFRDRAGHSSAT